MQFTKRCFNSVLPSSNTKLVESCKVTRAKILIPLTWRYTVADYVIGLSYRPVKLHRLAVRYDNSMP
jgi:hypothetical protein